MKLHLVDLYQNNKTEKITDMQNTQLTQKATLAAVKKEVLRNESKLNLIDLTSIFLLSRY